uniref:hypothetical protein n=1 Tax=Cytobacillus oceanisediminis TaxID=665099 RepID=UPI001C92DF77
NMRKYEVGEEVDEVLEGLKGGEEWGDREGWGVGVGIGKWMIDVEEGWVEIEVEGDVLKVRVVLEELG